MKGPEKIVELDIERKCIDAGARVRRLQLIGKRGWPDLTISANGKTVYVEVKEPGGGEVSQNQLDIHEELREDGFIVLVATSARCVPEILRILGL